eukprot:TRINITY_DN246_c0_g2_i2.p1 TRINITY_DN246_c0_g2~~TRINITY_DN246_c0_g2_i2.p1  ORF type:complete len:142 (+),score=31.28 TRINITY_DN246_c0_g2_i2:144-569(+)
MKRNKQVFSALPFQMFLYYGAYLDFGYVVLSIFLFIFKGLTFPYPDSIYGWELAFLFMYGFVESVRLLMGNKGNKIEEVRPLIWYWILSVGVIIANVYYMSLQVYVLMIDFIIGLIMLIVNSLQIILSFVTALMISRTHSI